MKTVLFGNSTWCLYNFRRGLIAKLVELGHTVHVIAPCDATYDNDEYIKRLEELNAIFHPLPLKPRNLNPLHELRSLLALFLLLRKIKPDVLLTFTIKCNLYTGLCRTLLSFQQIANVPGLGEVFERRSFVQRLAAALYKFSFRGIRAALFQNKDDLNYCVRHNLVKRSACKLIPGSGVDLTRFSAAPPRRATGKFVFLMFGRLLPQKGYYQYLRAADVLRSILGETVEFWIIGIEDKNRTESRELALAIEEAAQDGIVRRFPAMVDVAPLLAQVDTVVLPSWYNEGIPRSLLEAMACAKPLITTDWKGCRDTVSNGENGYLVPVRDNCGLIKAMFRMVAADRDKLRQMGLASRAIVEKRYDEQVVIAKYVDVMTGDERWAERRNQRHAAIRRRGVIADAVRRRRRLEARQWDDMWNRATLKERANDY